MTTSVDYPPIIKGNQEKIEVTCKDRSWDVANEKFVDTTVNLTGATVTLLGWFDAATGEGTADVARAMTIVDAANGVAEYEFTATEFAAATGSTVRFRVKVVIGGKTRFFDDFTEPLEDV